MATGFLTPDARLRILSDLGVIVPGAKLHTYVAGTPSTNLATYSDAALTVPNTNPVVASAGGLFGPIYLTPNVAYKLVLTDAADVVIWSQDTITIESTTVSSLTAHGVLVGTGTAAIGATGAGTAGQLLTSNGAATDPTFQDAPAVNAALNLLRLTLTTATPITTTDVTAATSIFLTPYTGKLIALYSAAGAATIYSTAEISIAVPATTSQMYDIFCFANAGVPTLELLAWTNDTTRATALVRTTTGTLTKSGDLTRRYLGSFRTTAVSGQTEDSGFGTATTKRYLWNYYHRVPRPLCRVETTTSWTYTTATIRQANAAAANQVEVVVGVAEVPIDLSVTVAASNGSSDGTKMIAQVGIGEDSTSTFATGLSGGAISLPTLAAFLVSSPGTARLVKNPAVGRHVYSWNEWSQANGTTTWYGTPSGASGPSGSANGLSGRIEG